MIVGLQDLRFQIVCRYHQSHSKDAALQTGVRLCWMRRGPDDACNDGRGNDELRSQYLIWRTGQSGLGWNRIIKASVVCRKISVGIQQRCSSRHYAWAGFVLSDATFMVWRALNGAAEAFSFEMPHFPGRFLSVNENRRLIVQTVDQIASDDFANRASFRVERRDERKLAIRLKMITDPFPNHYVHFGEDFLARLEPDVGSDDFVQRSTLIITYPLS